ncbi:dab2-interacting protein, putative [Entamoeba dispar SAW760]|uniref:Dab2-interacting protein, putative n=2 Tax=Entamoeba dispar (strain ATCC PRA-260 / SAW760) TaxID=370354 RepID=B0ETS4_ENTDS|nr:dab2-interacting protein, putative [Entamoeba dispar SAW760]EDR22071.1 dab2-interacting protein, putative [Entamoeba dispar SAW760]|eukprot:EDR22071.1 dab2-interacting protein, putative [Entamoeba dispar SAW760]
MNRMGNEIFKLFTIERIKTVDQEYQMIREKSIESEKKLFSTLQNIIKLKNILHEAALLQVEISYSLCEMTLNNLKATQLTNSILNASQDILTQQNHFNSFIKDNIEIPLHSFLNQFRMLSRRDCELEERRKKMDKMKQHLVKKKRKKLACSYLISITKKYQESKEEYLEMRNELKNDRNMLLKTFPEIAESIGKGFIREGWGCLLMNSRIWERVSQGLWKDEEKSILEVSDVITNSIKTRSIQNNITRKPTNVFHGRVVYSYNPQNESELKLEEGEWITVISTEGEWWEGESKGKIGIFPSHYVERDVKIN